MTWNLTVNAASVDDALEYLDRFNSEARIISGGTDLMLELERGTRKGVTTLIDVTRIPGSFAIYEDDESIHIGFNVTHSESAVNPLIQRWAPALSDACWAVGSPQIRNRGTIVGNVVTGSPANDTIPALIALNAKLEIRSFKNKRFIPIDQFYFGVRKVDLQPTEMVTALLIPKVKGQISGFYKHGLRRAQAISVVNAAASFELDSDGRVRGSRICLGSVAPTIVRALDAERYLSGKVLNEDNISIAAQKAITAATPISDLRASDIYRKDLVSVVVRRSIQAAINPPHRNERFNLVDRSTNQTVATPQISGDDSFRCRVNGSEVTVSKPNSKNLLHLLRDDLHLIGSKEGCGEGECGACTVFLDGTPVMGCLVPASRADGAEIITIEGIGTEQQPHKVQRSFVAHGAVQCGYCTPGFVMSAVKLLETLENPSREQIIQSMTGNLCRCTGYYQIIEAVEKAAQENS